MRKFRKFFKRHYLGVLIISLAVMLEVIYLYNDFAIHGSWFFQRSFNKIGLMQYSIEIIIFSSLIFGGFLSDYSRGKRLRKMEDLKEVHFIDDVVMKLLKEPSFEKKLEIAISSVGKQIKICKSAFVVNENRHYNFYYKNNIARDDEDFIKNNILSAEHKEDAAHNNGFLFSEIIMHDLNGYIILKPCINLNSAQLEFLRRYERILLPIFSNARLIIALSKSKSNTEFLIGRYKMLHHFITDLQKSSTVEEVYWKLVSSSLTFFGVDSATVVDVSGEREKWHFAAIKNAANNRLKKVEDAIRFSNYSGTIVEVKEKKKIVYVPDTSKYEKWIPTESSPMSWIGIPLIKSKEVIAVFSIDGEEPNQFTDEDLIFTRILSDMVSSIIERISYMEKLNIYSITDSLTGLYNKREFGKRIKEEVNRARRYKRKLSIAIFDLDHFKQWNDTYGHIEGDHLLTAVGNLVHSSVRTSDIAFRFGGDEFVVIFPETGTEEAVNVIRHLSLQLSRLDIYGKGNVSFSAGVAGYKFGESAEEFIQRADLALYKAKEDKKDNIKVTA